MADELLQQTNKRLTLNLLIQGAAMHACLTAHHLVKDDLEAIRPGLTGLYDRFMISAELGYWMSDLVFLIGMPSKFWRRVHCNDHPFRRHRLLALHGSELSKASKRYLLERGLKKQIIGIPGLHCVQLIYLIVRVSWAERSKKSQLAELAKRATARIWGIKENRLEALITSDMRWSNLRWPKTWKGRILQMLAAGWSGVKRREGRFIVVAKAKNWPLVLHELVKGTAELICLHGLNTLDDKSYEAVTDEADKIEYEPWLLQAGQEMWRRLLAVLPHERSLAEVLMNISRLDPLPLERLMLAVINDPAEARSLLEQLG